MINNQSQITEISNNFFNTLSVSITLYHIFSQRNQVNLGKLVTFLVWPCQHAIMSHDWPIMEPMLPASVPLWANYGSLWYADTAILHGAATNLPKSYDPVLVCVCVCLVLVIWFRWEAPATVLGRHAAAWLPDVPKGVERVEAPNSTTWWWWGELLGATGAGIQGAVRPKSGARSPSRGSSGVQRAVPQHSRGLVVKYRVNSLRPT